jgi:hypothetical protein
MAYGGKHQPMEFVLLGDNISPSSRPGHERYAPACILDGPAQRVVYAGPDQSLQSVGRGAANGLPDRIGKNPKTARANIVTWADRRVGHVVDTTREPVAEPRLQRKAPAFDRASWAGGARLKCRRPPASAPAVARAGGRDGLLSDAIPDGAADRESRRPRRLPMPRLPTRSSGIG